MLFLACEDKQEEDTTPPTVSISSHSSGQTVNEVVTIMVTTQDNKGISKVEFFIDDSLVLSDIESPYQYDWNTTTDENGSEHIVKVISYDTSDNTTESQPIMLIVDNFNAYPTPVELYPITYENNGLYISWSQNNDNDFHSYTLMGIGGEMFTTNNHTDTSYTDTAEFSPCDLWYYAVVVEDILGLESLSNWQFTGILPNCYFDDDTSGVVIVDSLEGGYEISSGTILIQNNTDSTLVIKANGILIGNFIFSPPSLPTPPWPEEISYLPGDSNHLYSLQAGEYHFSAINATTDATVAETDINIEAGESYEWVINGQ